MSSVAYVTRVIDYTILTPSTVRFVCFLEVLHGVTYACTWIATVDYAARTAPPGLATTFQTILGATMHCVGGGVGPVVGGAVVDRYGARVMYRGWGEMVACVSTAHALAWACGRDNAAALRRSDAPRRGTEEATKRTDAATPTSTTVDGVRDD